MLLPHFESLLLRIVRVSVPSYRVRGQQAQFECDYELGGDRLYSVKWYRDNEEFYRYMPKYDPPQHAYKIDGVKVDLSKSNDRRVVLHQVTLKSSGLYRCEVSAEAPSFESAAGEGRMEVTDKNLLVEYPLIQHSHGLLSAALGLRVPTGRTMQVRCTARVAPAWREGSEAVVGNSQLADSKEAMLLAILFS
ncbi:unnamed protein product [Leptidea sinapis]|uniref:Ig-like domain-containing protein n=1 Tax=Leptidea sinapis TaxID=189913 RepID=A0A5E4QPE3_9NEOP|nr:unnamed protein product [Leptidea sinapis]